MAYTRRVNVRGIIFKDGKIFAQTIKKNGIESDYWCTPGGGMDDGETLEHALQREMIEETGIAPTIGKLLFMQQFHDGEKEQLEFFFHITNSDDYTVIDLTATSHGELEIGQCGFIDAKTENILPAFLQTVDIESYASSEQPVLITSEL
ncbi:NUDIX domain-containing protein [Microbacteriaceae bacterium]|nr:NUDIX domain-containing protein [Candidatus Saccharibacteria bacterium]